MPKTNAVTNTDIIAYQARKLAEYERELNETRRRNAALTAANEILADALSRALGGRDRVFVPRRRENKVEYQVELTIGDDLLIIRR